MVRNVEFGCVHRNLLGRSKEEDLESNSLIIGDCNHSFGDFVKGGTVISGSDLWFECCG